MKPGYRLFVLTIITFTFCSCKSNTTQVTTLPPADNVDSNTLPNKPTNNGKQKLLDMALKLSGEELPRDKRSKVLRMLSLNEKDVIRGLGVWLELLDGEYPNSLDPKPALKQAEALWRAKQGGVSPEKTTDKEKKKEAEEAIYDIFFASAFYDKLIREKKDVAYYGDKITVEDSGEVLMRWKISGGRYRVVFGNLTRKSVTLWELAELEKLTLE